MKLAVYVAAEAPTVIECDAAPLSLQLTNTYWVSVAPACGVAVAMVCDPGERLRVCGAVCCAPPSTLKCKPGGFVWMVTPAKEEKLAVTVWGALIVTVVALFDALATLPDQLVNE